MACLRRLRRVTITFRGRSAHRRRRARGRAVSRLTRVGLREESPGSVGLGRRVTPGLVVAARQTVPQKRYRGVVGCSLLWLDGYVRVKWWGKSPPRRR